MVNDDAAAGWMQREEEAPCYRGKEEHGGSGYTTINHMNPSLLGRWRSRRERAQNANTFVGAVFS